MKISPPSVNINSFNCPHCGTLTTQYWYSAHAKLLEKGKNPGHFFDKYQLNQDDVSDTTIATSSLFSPDGQKIGTGRPFHKFYQKPEPCQYTIYNVHFSKCYNCEEIAIWIRDKIIYPANSDVLDPNEDLPAEIAEDFREAGTILNLSPRGAAALLRLCIQKLCKSLGQKGKNINEDIAALVRQGLHIHVKQALDVVRVIGNDAVHPGQIDLKDDRATAEKLFGLINLIAEIMITQPKHISEMFESLPEEKRKQIENRDKQT